MFSGNIDPNINIIGDPPTVSDENAGGMLFDALPTESASAVAESALSSRPIRVKLPTLKAAESQDYAEGCKEQKAAVRARVKAADADEMAGDTVETTKLARERLRKAVVRESTVESAKAKRARSRARKRRHAKQQELRTHESESESDRESEVLARAQPHESVDIGVVNFPSAVTDDVCKEALGRYRDLL